jgi:ferredoxin-NADP reductase
MFSRILSANLPVSKHDNHNEGDEVTLRGPYREFYLRESHRDILLVTTGAGLAPIMSILHQIEKENIVRKTILFVEIALHMTYTSGNRLDN